MPKYRRENEGDGARSVRPRRLKGKNSTSGRHLISHLARGILILKSSQSWSRSNEAYSSNSPVSTSALLLLLLLLLFSFSPFFRAFHFCALVQLSPQLPSFPLSTSFLTYSFSQSAVPGAAAISLFDKSQVVRHPEKS